MATVILLLAPVFEAVKASRLMDPPITPFRLMLPAPELSVKSLLPATLLSVVPRLILPPLEARVLVPLTVVVPRSSVVSVVLMLPSIIVLDGLDASPVVTKPSVKVRTSEGELPRATVPVFRKSAALVMVLLRPLMATL